MYTLHRDKHSNIMIIKTIFKMQLQPHYYA